MPDMPSQAMQDAIETLRDRQRELLLGTPEAAQATEQVGTFLRTRVR